MMLLGTSRLVMMMMRAAAAAAAAAAMRFGLLSLCMRKPRQCNAEHFEKLVYLFSVAKLASFLKHACLRTGPFCWLCC